MRILCTLLGLTLILFGVSTLPLPLPVGLISIFLGSAILAATSKTFRRFIKWLRRHVKPINTVFEKAEEILPEKIAKPLRKTNPNVTESEHDEDTSEEQAKAPTQKPRPTAMTKKAVYRRSIARHPPPSR